MENQQDDNRESGIISGVYKEYMVPKNALGIWGGELLDRAT